MNRIVYGLNRFSPCFTKIIQNTEDEKTQHLHIRDVWLRSACIIYTSCLVTDKESKRMQSWCHCLLLQLLTVPRLPLYPSCGAVSTYSSTVCSPLSKSRLALKRLWEILLKTPMQLMTFSTYKNASIQLLTSQDDLKYLLNTNPLEILSWRHIYQVGMTWKLYHRTLIVSIKNIIQILLWFKFVSLKA